MKATDSHPSFLALDRAALGEASAEVRAHLKECPRCAEHVAAVSRPAPVPTWVSELGDAPPPRATKGWLWGLGLAACAALAVAIVVALVLPERAPSRVPATWPQRDSSEVLLSNPRGGSPPTVTLSIQRGEELRPWDGRSPVQAGDGLRFRVSPEGFSHVTVAAADGTTWRVLHARPVQPGLPVLLPPEARWEVRGDRESERLLVVFSDKPVDLSQASQWHAVPQRTDSLWTLGWTLPTRQP